MALLQGVLTDRCATLDDVRPWQRRTRHFDTAKALDARHGLRGEEEATRSTLSDLALMWTVASPALTCRLVGSRTVAQLEANLRAVAWPLAADVMARLNAITRPLKGRLGRSFDYYETPENDRTR